MVMAARIATVLAFVAVAVALVWAGLTQSAVIGNTLPVLNTAAAILFPTPEHQYVEVTAGCRFDYVGDCVNVRTGPGLEYQVALKLRTGVVLRVATSTVVGGGREWYKVEFIHQLLYPERVDGAWYVAAETVSPYFGTGDVVLTKTSASTTKRVVVDVGQQMLFAYDGDALFMEEPISTGLEFTPTPRGTFTVFKMTPSRFMQGPIPGVSEQVYDLPGVPWNLYFTEGGAVIHGAYWHDSFGKKWSHGCVNMPPQKAKALYEWAEIGMKVVVQ